MKDLPYDLWEPVIGLEIHVQLNTKSKLFASSPNHFGDEPNVNISPLDTGQPGSLPTLNREAVKKAIQFGLSVDANIALTSQFDRKSYFYPDSARNYQITQYSHPIIRGGSIEVDVAGVTKRFQIERAHLEDDAGTLKHYSTYSGIDFNRSGAPLLEIVSEPCMHTPKEASQFAMAIRSLMIYLNATDGNMEKGFLRIDANISVRPKGEKTYRPRIEIKNINSFSFLEMAITSEVSRQISLYTTHPNRPHLELIPPGTYRWDSESKQTVLMRAKEKADDYRYFPEPDLMPLILSQDWIDAIRTQLPELPHHRFNRYVSDLGISRNAAATLIDDKYLSDYFEEALKSCSNPGLLCNWIIVEFAGRVKEKSFSNANIPPAHVAKLVEMIDQNQITGRIAKSVADEMVATGLDPEIIVRQNPNFHTLGDSETIEKIIDQVIAANPQSVADFKAGKEKAFTYLVGQVMKETRGTASPEIVNQLLRKKTEGC